MKQPEFKYVYSNNTLLINILMHFYGLFLLATMYMPLCKISCKLMCLLEYAPLYA